jgi:hypothetical protein
MSTQNNQSPLSDFERMVSQKRAAGLNQAQAEFAAKLQLNQDAREAGEPEPFPSPKEGKWPNEGNFSG